MNRDRKSPRQGSALLVVLVVVMLLSLAAYTYTQTMQTELESAVIHAQDVQARQSADSGVDYVATLLARRSPAGEENFLQNPGLFSSISVVDANRPTQRAQFSVIAPVESDLQGTMIRYGLVDESSRLNLNLLDELQQDQLLEDEDITTWMLGIPGMTNEIADAIRDWIDDDEEKRPYGGESEVYQSLQPPYSAKNGPLESLDELLLVRDVTPQLLYGEDANRNGLLDPNENDGEASPPLDNADGMLNPGWSAYLTVHSRERNVRTDGTPRINLNNGFLTDLYDQLEEAFNEDTAKFVVAYRMNGPKEKPKTAENGPQFSGKSPKNPKTVVKNFGPKEQEKAVQKIAEQVAGAMFKKGGDVTRGGMELSKGGPNRVKSIYDLIGVQTTATVKGATQTLDSPWPADPGALQQLLPMLSDILSTTDDDHLVGRININSARPEVLVGMPNMTADLAKGILAAQSQIINGTPSPDLLLKHSTPGWLLVDGLVDLETMRVLDPLLCARGDVYRAQVLGFFASGGPVHRQEAVIDATRMPPRVVWQRDLNELGRGYVRSQLTPIPAR